MQQHTSDSPKNLFDAVPPGLFQPLAAPTRRLYSAALARLYRLAQAFAVIEEDAAVETVVVVVAAASEEEQAELSSDVGDDVSEVEVDEDSGNAAELYRQQRMQARAMLRRLEDTGWLKREKQPDLSYHYTLPEYAFPLLESFEQVTERRAIEFEGLIYNTFLLFLRPDTQMSNYALLQQAQDQSRRISAGLKQLQHNIGLYIEQLVKDLQIREVLANFVAYREEVSPSYHRLKTADHLARYRLDIQQAVTRCIRDHTWIAEAAREARRRQPDLSQLEAEGEIYRQLDYVYEQFEQMAEIMERIDARHSQYAEAAVSQVRYRIGGGPDQLQQLVALARQLGSVPGRRAEAPSPYPVTSLFHLYEVDYLTRHSLYTPRRVNRDYRPEPVIPPHHDPALLRSLREQAEREIEEVITPEKVRAYIAPYLAVAPEVASADLPLSTVEEWLFLIGLNLYADLPDSPYVCAAPPQDQPWVCRDGLRCPNLRFLRREL